MACEDNDRDMVSINEYLGRAQWPGLAILTEGQILPDWTVLFSVGDRVRSIESGRIGTVKQIIGSPSGITGSITVQYGDEFDWEATGVRWFRKVAD